MEILTKQANTVESYVTESFVEKEAEVSLVQTSGKRPGSVLVCIDSGAVYVLNSKYQWTLLGGGS